MPLNEKQERVLHLVGLGMTAAEIAEQTGQSKHTVANHCNAIHRELGSKNMAHAIAIYLCADTYWAEDL